MPRTSVVSSRDQLAVFNAGLHYLVRLGRVPRDVRADPSPYPLWLLDADDLSRPEPSQFAYQAGWRFFATSVSSPQTVVGADIAGGTEPLLLNLSYDPQVAEEYDHVKQAEAFDLQKGLTFSVRILRIPGGLVQAVWAKPEAVEDAGQLLPFGKSFVKVDVDRMRYPTNEYLQQVHPTASIPRRKGIRPKSR